MLSDMGTFENPDLRASATRIVCLNHFALIPALRKKVGFDQSKSYLTLKPRFLVYTPVLMKLLAIRLVKLLAIPLGCQKTATKWLVIGYQPKSFWPGTRKTIAKSLVMSLVEGPTIMGAANIFFEQPLRGLFAFLFARVAYDSVRTAQFHSINPAPSLPAFGATEGWMRIARLLYWP
jgi:hypothetical protein